MEFIHFIWQLLIFFIALSILVMIHEFGHLLFAKMFNVYCYEFSIGMGPRVASKKAKETRYSLKAFPIGGSVSMAGEEIDAQTRAELGELYNVDVPLSRTLYGIKKWKRLFVVGGGALFNFIFGLLLVFVVVNAEGVKIDPNTRKIQVDDASLIYENNVRSGDEIYRLDIELVAETTKHETFEIVKYSDITDALSNEEYIPTTVNQRQYATFYYYRLDSNGDKQSGISDRIERRCTDSCSKMPLFGFTIEAVPLTTGERFTEPFKRFGEYSIAIFKGLGSLFTSGFGNVSGPVGIFNASSQIASYGFVSYLSFLALLTINLGIFNLIPFPGLDGATIFMTLGEMISGHEIPQKAKGYINFVGLILLLFLIFIVSIKDIIGLF